MVTPAADQLIERAQAALRLLGDAPEVAEPAFATMRLIADAWPRRPLRIGIGGDDPAMRAAVLDAACGGVLPVTARVRGATPLRVRRGTATRFRVMREGAPPEEHVFVPQARVRAETAGDDARRELAVREHELAELERSLPGELRVPPPRWALWRRIVWWWRRRRAKAAFAARDRALLALEAARHDVAELDARRPARAPVVDADLTQFFAAVGLARPDATEIEVEVAGGPLADDIELIELAGAVRAGADVDAVVIATPGGVLAPVRDGAALRVGEAAQVIRALPVLLVHARALNLAREARDRLDAACATIEGVLERAEADFEMRLAKLEMRRVPDAASLRAEQLDRAKAECTSHIGAVLDHAASHLDAELASVRDAWAAALAQATCTAELKTALAGIDAAWPETAQRIAREVHVLVTGGLAGSVHDLVPAVIAPLRAYGLTDRATPAPASPAAIPALASLVNPTTARWAGAGEWFTGLFRSFEARRAELADKVSQRADHVRDVARAELLDAQPLMHGALAEALAAELDAALARQATWLEAELDRERAAIRRDRAALEPLQRTRDRAARDSRELTDHIEELEAELPGTAAASVAARLSVGSMPRPSLPPG